MWKKLAWYRNRFACMSGAEIGHRIARQAHMAAERAGFLTAARVPAASIDRAAEPWVSSFPRLAPEAYVAAADRILEGRVRVLALEDAQLGRIPRWCRNPASGQDVPLRFGKALDYRDQRLVGDIKYLWVLNRHTHLVTLAQAHRLTGEPRFLAGIREHLRSWIEQCPYLRGPNWTSSLELAIRLINWSFVWHLLGGSRSQLFDGADGDALRRDWLETIYRHAHFVSTHFSRHSSANNHLIGESAGLLVAALTWPFWDEMKGWRVEARDELVRELELQNAPDGVNREQSVFYQRFVLELALSALVLGRRNGVEFPPSCLERISSMMEFLASIMDVRGNLPMIGDADGCSILSLSQEPGFDPYRSLLATGAVLFERPAFKAKASRLDEATLWLLGDQAREVFAALDPRAEPLPVRREFPDGGYHVLGCEFETEREVRIVADVGPLGYLSLAAHGHADALAFTLSVGGREFLVDPGTYAYQTKKEWRGYFRGTAAHNTIRVDGEDQSVSGGAFIWVRRAKVTRRLWETSAGSDRVVGSHDGYARLSDPVEHVRAVHFDKATRVVMVEDTLACRGTHQVEMSWHFAEECRVQLRGRELLAEREGVSILLSPPAGFGQVQLLEGRESPPAGWVSRRFDCKVPAPTLVVRGEIHGTRELVTKISVAN